MLFIPKVAIWLLSCKYCPMNCKPVLADLPGSQCPPTAHHTVFEGFHLSSLSYSRWPIYSMYLCVAINGQQKEVTHHPVWADNKKIFMPPGHYFLSSTGHGQSSIPNNAICAMHNITQVPSMSTPLDWSLSSLYESPCTDPVPSSWSMTLVWWWKPQPNYSFTSQTMYTCRILPHAGWPQGNMSAGAPASPGTQIPVSGESS